MAVLALYTLTFFDYSNNDANCTLSAWPSLRFHYELEQGEVRNSRKLPLFVI